MKTSEELTSDENEFLRSELEALYNSEKDHAERFGWRRLSVHLVTNRKRYMIKTIMRKLNMTLPLLFLFSLGAQEMTDLGLVTHGIKLEKCKRRPDLLEFQIEFMPQNFPTNKVTMVKTNEMLTMEDLRPLPSGLVIMSVKQICADGDQSPISRFYFDLRWDDKPLPDGIITELMPSPPKATSVPNNLLERQAAEVASWPPIPGMPITLPQPLPGGTNKTYGEHVAEMAKALSKTGRRSE